MPADDRRRVLARVDRHGDAGLLLGEAALPRLAVAVRELGVVHVYLVDPDPVPEDDPVLVPSTVAKTRCLRSQAVWCVTRMTSATHSTGTLNRTSVTDSARSGRPSRVCPKTVPARGSCLLPQAGHLQRCTPEAVRPSLVAANPHDGQGGRGLKALAASASVPRPSPRGTLSRRRHRAAGRSRRRGARRRAPRAGSPGSACSAVPSAMGTAARDLSPNEVGGGPHGKHFDWRVRA